MKTEYKHIHFDDVSYLYPERKTQVWECLNEKADVLGRVKWYSSWRQYCFNCEDQIILAKSCLADIVDFIKQLMAERKSRKDK